MEIYQLVLMDHVASKNLTIDWESVRLGKGTRLEGDRGERSHLHQDVRSTRMGGTTIFHKYSQSCCATRPHLMEGLFRALMKVPVWYRNILAGKIFLSNSPCPKGFFSIYMI